MTTYSSGFEYDIELPVSCILDIVLCRINRFSQAELESLDPVGYLGVNVSSAGLSAQYERMWRVTFMASSVEGNVEAMQVTLRSVAFCRLLVIRHCKADTDSF